MTSSDETSVAAGESVACPRCAGRLEGGGETRTCRRCRRPATVFVFEPRVDAAPAAPGTGRCAHHPNKDAADSCARCGSFVCDVCATRTGEQVLCPACFDTLHERGDLATTRTGRVRWDQMTLSVGLLSLFWTCAVVSMPVTFALGTFTLFRRRKEPWLSLARTVWGMVLALVGLAGFVAMVFAMRKK